jgi:hypothetical protein
MPEIRYVVLSDLHFGAENSLLTSVVESPDGVTDGNPDGFTADPTTPSPLVGAVLAGLRHLTAGQPEPPTLILAGDVLDFALSPDAVAATAFEGFVDLAWCGPERVFAPAVYYLPGNHDHHLWEGAREAQYIRYLRELAPDQPMAPPWHTTGMLPERQPPWTASDLLSTLIQRRPGAADVAVRVVYPNLALTAADAHRACIISHGHYTESIYTLMSQLRGILFPDQGRGALPSVATLEVENFAWIDFFWSTLGRSGDVGTDVGLIYADLSNPAALDILARNLVRGALGRGHGREWTRPVELALANALVRREVRHMANSERSTPDVTLSPKSRLGLRDYLEGPLRRQIVEDLGAVPADVTFIFGHTHKPFVEEWSVLGYPKTVRIHNTGGWVVDSAQPAPSQGGVAVLIDDDLNAASLQFYRQTGDGGTAAVQVLAPADPRGANALHAHLAAAIRPEDEPWRTVSSAAADLLAWHHRIQAALLNAKQDTT